MDFARKLGIHNTKVGLKLPICVLNILGKTNSHFSKYHSLILCIFPLNPSDNPNNPPHFSQLYTLHPEELILLPLSFGLRAQQGSKAYQFSGQRTYFLWSKVLTTPHGARPHSLHYPLSWMALGATDSEQLYLTNRSLEMVKKENIPHCWANYRSKFPEELLLPSLESMCLRKMHLETLIML